MAEYFIERSLIREQVRNFVQEKNNEKTQNLIFVTKIFALYFLICSLIYSFQWFYQYGTTPILVILPFYIIGIGCLQYAIAQAAHEAIHFHIDSNNNRWYSLICSFLMLYPIGLTKNYKKMHMMHHMHFGDPEKDPDHSTFMHPPTTKLQVWLLLIESITGLSTLKRIISIIFLNPKILQNTSSGNNLPLELLKLALTQSFIFLTFSSLGLWWGYFVLWLFPLAFVAKTLINFRLLAEHSPSGNEQPALRSFLKMDWSTYLLGVFGFRYHAEHHLFPGVAYPNLNKITLMFKERANTPQQSENGYKIELLEQSYIQFLKKFYLSLPPY